MRRHRSHAALAFVLVAAAWAPPALALANRVFVSARSGNNANSCDNIGTPCQTFAGAVLQLNPDGEVIVLDSGGYGPVTITQGVTIEAPAGVTAFIHPPGGDAITVNAGSAKVTLRGLTLNVGANGILVGSVGTLNVENCFITGFSGGGIRMLSAGRLNVKGTDVKACGYGVEVANSAGLSQVSIDHCHLDGNFMGFQAFTTSPGSSTTAVTHSTANNNQTIGWECGDNLSNGQDVLNLEFCSGSENAWFGLYAGSTNAASAVSYSNCVFSNNGQYGVARDSNPTLESRVNNTIEGNGLAPTFGSPTVFAPM
jgi:hypothetical protein